MKRVMCSRKDWGASDEALLRRWQAKWKTNHKDYLATARDRAEFQRRAAAARSLMQTLRRWNEAFKSLQNSPALREWDEKIKALQKNSPALREWDEKIKALQNSPALREWDGKIKSLQNSPAWKGIDGFKPEHAVVLTRHILPTS